MRQEIFISIDEREARAALYEDGRLMETLIARDDSQVGQIFKGRVQNVIAGMNAAFVDIGMDRNGFLCADDASAHLQDLDNPLTTLGRRRITDIAQKGQDTIVQIAKEVIGKKGARLTTNISLSGRYFVLLPTIPACHIGISRKITDMAERERLHELARQIVADRCGTIVRTAAENGNEEELSKDWEALWTRWEDIKRAAKVLPVPSLLYRGVPLVDKVVRDMVTAHCERIVIDNRTEYQRLLELLDNAAPHLKGSVELYTEPIPLFTRYEIDSAIEKGLYRKVHLRSGGNLVVERTEALWVIDVNTAQNIDKNAILSTNLEACKEVCRQMRLRDMGGIIIVDFINMESAQDQESLLASLAEELKRDRVRTKLVSMTELGLVQITRKREGKDLGRIMCEICPTCYGNGRVLSARSTALKAYRELCRCHGERRSPAYIVRLSPRAAWHFVGERGENAADLSAALQCELRIEADCTLSPGQFEVVRGDLGELRDSLSLGQQNEALMVAHFGSHSDSCLTSIDGHLVEVTNGDTYIGQQVVVRVTQVGEHISVGKVVKKD